MNYDYKVGIDEVGRGPVAGPTTVCAFAVSKKNTRKVGQLLRGIRDSKKLSESQRENWFKKLDNARKNDLVDYAVSFVGPKSIDNIGITRTIQNAINRSLRKLQLNPKSTYVVLDGGLHASKRFISQKTIIRGEDREKLIAAASIVAKVSRDCRMKNYAKQFPDYKFQQHKGYGTKQHMRTIKRYGLCPLHRRSFL